MPEKEATARIKINRLLNAAGWRFFPENGQPGNIRLEPVAGNRSGLFPRQDKSSIMSRIESRQII